MKTLVVYFSSSGNTESIAKMIADETNADILQIKTVDTYSLSEDEVYSRCKDECESGYTPEIMPVSANIADYDRIVIGTPTWWYTMAPAILSFFKQTKLDGKEVVLYMTNAGWSGMVIKNMIAAAKGAKVIATKEILFDADGGNMMITPEDEIKSWINSWK